LFQAQALHVISEKPDQITFSEIVEVLPYDPSQVSRVLKKLEKKGLILRRTRKNDRRSYFFSLSHRGQSTLLKHQTSAGELIGKALHNCSESEALEFVNLLEKIVGAELHPGEIVLEQSVKIRRMIEEEDRSIARGFFVEQMVRLQKHFSLPEKLFVRTNCCFVLLQSEKIKAVCEIEKDNKILKVKNLATSSGLNDHKLLELFIQHASQQAAEINSISNFEITLDPQSKGFAAPKSVPASN
ncbi:MAG: MarR family transcriptional regulator, partial [Bdellovibrionales bacterium]|nr:MarR family transcriptional regulator [Bdellovibrionales bacterium]